MTSLKARLLSSNVIPLAVGMVLAISGCDTGTAETAAAQTSAVVNPCAAKPCAALNPCAANPCAAAPLIPNPCAANPCAANPCAGANPCAANPCAANPCAVVNPCAANPCAANPCAPAAAAELSGAEAATTYDKIAGGLRAGYAKSDHPVATAYFTWNRYNKVPYVSETHGGRHVNNFANDLAKAYGRFEKAGVMPEGSVLAKDSFRLTPQGEAQPGPLFLMEKMAAGFSPDSADWRYTMIMPNGAVFGTTEGRDAAKVQFCADCHGGSENDSLFFLPEEQRVRF